MNVIMLIGIILMAPFLIFCAIYFAELTAKSVKAFTEPQSSHQKAILIIASFIVGLTLYIYSIVGFV